MKRLLIANRGEIAIRIISAARELDIHTIAIYVASDTSHTSYAHEAVRLPDVSGFLDISRIIRICQDYNVDAVHPGYGFLSESSEFAQKLSSAGVVFVGPSADILSATGDKLQARELAKACNVPVIPALTETTSDVSLLAEFGHSVGWPIMIKAVDGGGGRGIRLAKSKRHLSGALQRAIAESPSRKVFAEKAAVGGWRHVEVQILGDGTNIRHYWERECSIQRRYQKLVEIAPSSILDRRLVASLIECALRIARSVSYCFLGTFEFLVSPQNAQFYFMEINPRLQVEHTVTESLCNIDLVRLQLLIAQGKTLPSLDVPLPPSSELPPTGVAMQLRVTAEDVRREFSLSIGRINAVSLPGGNGVRVDTYIKPGVIVSHDFDSLLAKVILTSSDRDVTIKKGIRALEDLRVEGVTTNIALLKGILSADDFRKGNCDLQWLENNLNTIVQSVSHTRKSGMGSAGLPDSISTGPPTATGSTSPSSAFSFRKGDCWKMDIAEPTSASPKRHIVQIKRLLRNDFPSSLAAEVSVLFSDSKAEEPSQRDFKIEISQPSFSVNDGVTRRGNPSDPTHLLCPISGQLVEVLVDEGDTVDTHEVIAVVRQMKMEIEIRAHKAGIIKHLWDAEPSKDVADGYLVCEILDDKRPRQKL